MADRTRVLNISPIAFLAVLWGRVKIDPEWLKEEIPDDLAVVAVDYDLPCNCIRLLLSSQQWPEVREGDWRMPIFPRYLVENPPPPPSKSGLPFPGEEWASVLVPMGDFYTAPPPHPQNGDGGDPAAVVHCCPECGRHFVTASCNSNLHCYQCRGKVTDEGNKTCAFCGASLPEGESRALCPNCLPE